MYGMFDTLFLLYSMHNDTSTLVTVDRNAFPNRATFDLEPERLIQYDHNIFECTLLHFMIPFVISEVKQEWDDTGCVR